MFNRTQKEINIMKTTKTLAATVALFALPLIFAANSNANAPKTLKKTASFKHLKEECQKQNPDLKGKELSKCIKEKRATNG
jgi:lactate dehydrogenase-like 2-hydroxyacid dehydrogenase